MRAMRYHKVIEELWIHDFPGGVQLEIFYPKNAQNDQNLYTGKGRIHLNPPVSKSGRSDGCPIADPETAMYKKSIRPPWLTGGKGWC